MRLEAIGICKHYGADRALREAALELQPGEIHALLGENGAGKSTLARIIGGAERPCAGRLLLDERPYLPRTPREAMLQGVAVMGQQARLAEDLTVEENLGLGLEPARAGWVARRPLREQALWALGELQSRDLPLSARAGALSPADRLRVELARALLAGTRVLVLDEPTRALSHWETGPLFQALRRLAGRGVAVLFISHFLEEALALCKRYTVLREGQSVASGQMAATSRAALLEAMAGEPVDEACGPRAHHHFGRGVLWLDGVCGGYTQGISLKLYAGQILGLAGLEGAGRHELLELVGGQKRPRAGKIWRGGGIGMAAPAKDGIFEGMDVADNLTLPALDRFGKAGVLSLEAQTSAAQDWMAKLHLRARSPRQKAETLCGGARQKLRLGRLLMQNAAVLLVEEPTQGLDPRARLEIYHLANAVAAEGKGILWVSPDPGELLRVCDTIALLRGGRLVEIRPSAEWTEPEMISAALGPP